MVEKKYNIFLEGKILGSTKLEFGDPPMGIVFGQISFVDRNLGYDFIKKYCIDNSIEIQIDYPDEKLITTGIIEKLNIFNSNNNELKGIGNFIEGMDSDSYTISIYGLDNEVFKQEFPEHIIEYERKQLSDND